MLACILRNESKIWAEKNCYSIEYVAHFEIDWPYSLFNYLSFIWWTCSSKQRRQHLRDSHHFNRWDTFFPVLFSFFSLYRYTLYLWKNKRFFFSRLSFMRILKEGKKRPTVKGTQYKGNTTNEKAELEDEHQDGLYIGKVEKRKEYLSILNVRPLLCHYTIHNFTNTMRACKWRFKPKYEQASERSCTAFRILTGLFVYLFRQVLRGIKGQNHHYPDIFFLSSFRSFILSSYSFLVLFLSIFLDCFFFWPNSCLTVFIIL